MPGFSEQMDEGLRVIGRLAALAGASLLALFLFGVALKPLLPDGLPEGPDGRMIFMIIVACALAIGHLLAGIVLERGRWEPTGLGGTSWRPFALMTGPALGVVAIAAPAVVLLLLGRVEIRVEPGAGSTAYAVDAFLPVALMTLVVELTLRGYAIGLIAERWGDVAAVLHSPRRGVSHSAPPDFALLGLEPAWLTGGAKGISEGAAVAVSLAVVTFLVFRPRRTNARQARV